jgi:hypothetical protein
MNDGATMTALKAIYVQVAGGKHTVSGQKAWIRSLAATALHAAGIPAGADIEWGGKAVTLWHGDIEPRLLGAPEVPALTPGEAEAEAEAEELERFMGAPLLWTPPVVVVFKRAGAAVAEAPFDPASEGHTSAMYPADARLDADEVEVRDSAGIVLWRFGPVIIRPGNSFSVSVDDVLVSLQRPATFSEPLPAYVPGPGQGQTHRHGTDEPGWIEHNHMAGGVPHQHDADGYQVPVGPAPEMPPAARPGREG